MYSFHSITQQKQSREINKKTYETFDIQLKKCVEYENVRDEKTHQNYNTYVLRYGLRA